MDETDRFEIDKERFGAFLARLRKEKGMTQKELAERLFVSDKAVSKWERALSLPDVALLIPLADCLGVSVAELLRGERERPGRPSGSGGGGPGGLRPASERGGGQVRPGRPAAVAAGLLGLRPGRPGGDCRPAGHGCFRGGHVLHRSAGGGAVPALRDLAVLLGEGAAAHLLR